MYPAWALIVAMGFVGTEGIGGAGMMLMGHVGALKVPVWCKEGKVSLVPLVGAVRSQLVA